MINVYQQQVDAVIWFQFVFFLQLQLFTFPVLQQFGLLFKERLEGIGLSASEITTIINLNPCITSCVGEQKFKWFWRLKCYKSSPAANWHVIVIRFFEFSFKVWSMGRCFVDSRIVRLPFLVHYLLHFQYTWHRSLIHSLHTLSHSQFYTVITQSTQWKYDE